MVGADRQNLREVKLFQRADELATFPGEATSQDHIKMEALCLQFLNHLDGQRRLGLIRILWLEARFGLVHCEEQGERDEIRHAIGIDGDHPVGSLPDVADVLGCHILGRLPLFAIACLVDAQRECPSCQRLFQLGQPSLPQLLDIPRGRGHTMVQGLRIAFARRFGNGRQGLAFDLGKHLELPRIWRVREEKSARIRSGGFDGQNTTDVHQRI